MAWDYQFKSSGEVDGTQGFREIITEYIDFSGGGGSTSVNVKKICGQRRGALKEKREDEKSLWKAKLVG